MAEPKLREVLSRIATELHDEEVAEEFKELKDRKASWEEVMEAIRSAPPEARAELRAILADETAGARGARDNGKEDKPDDKDDKGVEDPDADDPDGKGKPKRRKRPGRRSGAAYDWYVDDDGQVVRSPVAVIYSGEDEPDEVEMLDEEDDDGEGREGE